MALMCPGVPVSDWAIIEPCVSKTPQARSCDSRTTVLKAVRINVTCCSFTTESKRFHSTSRVIGSSVLVIAKYPRLGVLVQQAGCAVRQYGNDNPAQQSPSTRALQRWQARLSLYRAAGHSGRRPVYRHTRPTLGNT